MQIAKRCCIWQSSARWLFRRSWACQDARIWRTSRANGVSCGNQQGSGSAWIAIKLVKHAQQQYEARCCAPLATANITSRSHVHIENLNPPKKRSSDRQLLAFPYVLQLDKFSWYSGNEEGLPARQVAETLSLNCSIRALISFEGDNEVN